jgi:hypothetical protein
MEKNKFKFKYIKTNNKEEWSNKYCKKINFKGNSGKIEKTEEISSKLNNIECILNKLIANKESDKDKSTDNNKLESSRALVKLSPKNLLNCYEDYPTKLIRFYFTMQLHCSYPPVMNLREYFNCNRHFNNKLPLYLTYAILSKSSLNSPTPQLYMKNIEFSNYYYNLSLQELNSEVSNGVVSIYMLHALLILIGIDQVLSRNLNKSNRLVTCIKLSQMLNLSSSPNTSTIQKLSLFLKFYDFDTAQVLNKPKLIKGTSDPKYDDFDIREEGNFDDLAIFNLNNEDLPKDYRLTFEACRNFIHLIFPKIDSLERDLNLSSANHNYSECCNLIEYVTSLYDKLSPSIKYSDECINTNLITKDPLLRLRLGFYHSLLRESARVHSLSIKLIPNLETRKIFELVKKILKFLELPINLLKAQSLEFFDFVDSKVYLNLSTFYHLSNLFLDLIKALVNLKGSDRCPPNLACLEGLVRVEFNAFKGLVRNLESNWEGASDFVKAMNIKLSNIET